MNTMQRSLSLAACAVALFSAPAQAQSADDVAKKFIGAWKLVGATEVLPDGTKRAVPRYKTMRGYIMYTDDRHMCAILQDTATPKWKDVEKPTDAELISAKHGFYGYCGTYEINPKDETIVHHIEMDHVPNFIGQNRKRHYVMHDGNQVDMVVVDPPPPPGTAQRYLTWEKLGK